MLVQPAQDEGASSERLSVEQPSPSPTPTGEIPNESLPGLIPLLNKMRFSVSSQGNLNLGKAKINKLKKISLLSSKNYQEYLRITFFATKIPKDRACSRKQRVHKKNVSKQGRKKAKGESTAQRDPMFEVLAEDKNDHMETENAQTEGRTRDMVEEEKEFDEERLSTKDEMNLRKKLPSKPLKLHSNTYFYEFGDDETFVHFLIQLAVKPKLILRKRERCRVKDKGKKKIEEEEESESEDDDIPQVVKKFKQLESDEVLARKIQEDWEAEEERNKIAEETATNMSSHLKT
ncbi:hypothetical protein Tco_0872246 [Tanacetum coccineum]